MDAQSTAMTIEDGPHADWDIVASHIPHGIDALDDLFAIDLWSPGADLPSHSFQTYRYGYGWVPIQKAIHGADKDMHNVLTWWNTNHDSVTYAIHRVLVAIDETTWTPRDEIAQRLGPNIADLDPTTPYGRALDVAERHQLVTWQHQRSTPAAKLTPTAYQLIHPDDYHDSLARQKWLATTVSAADQTDVAALAAVQRTVAKAFPRAEPVNLASDAHAVPAVPQQPENGRGLGASRK